MQLGMGEKLLVVLITGNKIAPETQFQKPNAIKVFQLGKMLLLFLFIIGIDLTRSEDNFWNIENRILFGRDTTIREYPYLVSVENKGSFICEAVLVAPHIVFTTAHLTQNKSDLFVRAGTRYLRNNGRKLDVQEVHVHPNFNISTRDYDIAVLVLKGSFNITSKIKPIELVEMDFEVPAGFYAHAVGWKSSKEQPTGLQMISLQRVPCDIPRRTVTARMHCYSILGSIQRPLRNAGGPLILDEKLVGIDSWNYEYKKQMFYTVYVKVSYRNIYKFITQFF